MAEKSDTIASLLGEGRTFPPPADFTAQARIATTDVYAEAEADPEAFWAEQAGDLLDWFEPWHTVVDWDLPFAEWFLGGKLNASYNCLDRHVAAGRGDKVAYHWEGEPGDTRTITYADLLRDVSQLANALKALGVEKGDRVNIYLGMVPELPMALLACSRIGAAHSVVFGGFSSDSLRDRIQDAGAKVLITGDGAWRRGSIVPLKETADTAVTECPTIEKVLVLRRTEQDVDMIEGRDVWWHDLVPQQSAECAPEPMDSEDLLYLLYTSGTTARPKGIMHTTGGYLTQVAWTHQQRVRPAPRHRRVLVRGRRRVGDRPLLHRLRAAHERVHRCALRGLPRSSGQGPALGHGRALRRHHPLHRAHRDPHVHEVGCGVPREPRPLVAAAARQRG